MNNTGSVCSARALWNKNLPVIVDQHMKRVEESAPGRQQRPSARGRVNNINVSTVLNHCNNVAEI